MIASKKFLRTILDSIRSGAILIDPETHIIVDANNAAGQMFGKPIKKIVGNICNKYICTADIGKCPITDLNQAVDDSETILLKYDGKSCPIKKTAAYITLGDKKYILESFIDISIQKETENALCRKERFLKSILNGMQDGISVHDKYLNIIQTNTSIQEMYTDMLPLNGKKCYEAYHCSDTPCKICPAQRALKEGKPHSDIAPLSDSNGIKGWVELFAFPLLDHNGNITGVIEHVRDITERKKAESISRIQTAAIDAASDQILITDIHGNLEYVNPAFEKETGYSFNEIVNNKCSLFQNTNLQSSHHIDIWDTIIAGNTWRGEMQNRRKNGTIFIEEVTITPVRNEDNEIEHFVAIKRNITDKKIYEKKLDHIAHHDTLTGLPNRLLFADRLMQMISFAQRENESIAVMFIDLDRFKIINDTLGHNIGDILLVEVAKRLKSIIRSTDLIARMGGDEFTIILNNIKDKDEMSYVAERILASLSEVFLIQSHELFISASIGISIFPSDAENIEMLVKSADTAMYLAKKQGRNNYKFYVQEFNSTTMRKMKLQNDLRKAIDRNEFVIHYQPQVCISNGQILGTEALIRWQHPQFGIIAPDQFIPIAEETGLIVPISKIVLQEACFQNKYWQDNGFERMSISVNISSKELEQGDLDDTVKQVLYETQMRPEFLTLEITESYLANDSEIAVEQLNKLNQIGVKISIDDFGTGYSSLSQLKCYPVDELKIDRAFIKDVTSNSDDAAIADAIVTMAHSLKLKVIAEGVETIQQLNFLKSLHCYGMQGYFISKPMSADMITQFFTNSSNMNIAA